LQSNILNKLAKRLYELRETGRIIPFVHVGIGDGSAPDDWKPAPHFCHANVELWVMRSPEYTIVRGWVVFDQSSNPFVPDARFHFVAHSVIATPEGRLLDITPSGVTQPYPFIRHPGTMEEFDELRRQHQIMSVDYYLGT
jgi:hypothetical protein